MMRHFTFSQTESIVEAIRNNQSIKIGHLTGVAGIWYLSDPDFDDENNLPKNEYENWKHRPMQYVIYSYKTPIAWIQMQSIVVPNPQWVFTQGPQFITATTKKHLEYAKRWTAMIDERRPKNE